MNDIRSRLVACFATVFPNLAEREIPSASITSVAGWDSLAMANLVTVLEEEFGIEIRPQEVEQLVAFQQILQYLQSKV